jgi:cell wall-associated NlpC family hydrolase
MIGAPYRYGGTSPRGFDCSGLVYYAYSKVGIDAPRSTAEQYRQARRIQVSQLQPGDLIFFKISGNRVSHVGIYAGNDRFIHSPSSGKSVAYASLKNPYWRARLAGAGRLPDIFKNHNPSTPYR